MRGRPPATNKRNRQVATYCTAEEQELLKSVAESLSMTLSDYVRATLLEDATKSKQQRAKEALAKYNEEYERMENEDAIQD